MGTRPLALIAREVAADPGVGFSVRNVLLFAAGTNALGLYSCLVAAAAAISIKTVSAANPGKAHPDERLTLWIISAALFVTAAGALAKSELLPAAASGLFAAGNVLIAESLSKKEKRGGRLRLLLKRPDLSLDAGTALACLMAGDQALWVLPLVGASSVVALRNAWRREPEWAGRPKALIAAATLVSAAVSFLNANALIGVSHLIGAWVVFDVERRLIRRRSTS